MTYDEYVWPRFCPIFFLRLCGPNFQHLWCLCRLSVFVNKSTNATRQSSVLPVLTSLPEKLLYTTTRHLLTETSFGFRVPSFGFRPPSAHDFTSDRHSCGSSTCSLDFTAPTPQTALIVGHRLPSQVEENFVWPFNPWPSISLGLKARCKLQNYALLDIKPPWAFCSTNIAECSLIGRHQVSGM